MSFKKNVAAAAVLCALSAFSMVAGAQTIRIANQGDALSLDPHSLNESLQLSTTANVGVPASNTRDSIASIRVVGRPGRRKERFCRAVFARTERAQN